MNWLSITSRIASRFKPLGKQGSKLISKQTNIPIAKVKNIPIPKFAHTMDFVEISTKGGKGKTTVTSFKDSEGNLLWRNIRKTSKKETVSTTRTYWGDNSTLREIKSQTTVNGNTTQLMTSKHIFSKDSKTLDREKLTINYEKDNTTKEVQFFEKLKPHKQHQYVRTTASRNGTGEIVQTGINSNFVSQKELEEISKTPYLFAKNYEDEEFLRAIIPYSKAKQNVSDREITVLNERLSKSVEGTSRCYTNEIRVDLSKQAGNKSKIVNVTNHELRHQYQNSLMEKLENPPQVIKYKLLKQKLESRQKASLEKNYKKLISQPENKSKPLSAKEKKQAEQWAKETDNYIDGEKDSVGYLKQTIEKDAFAAGFASQKEYDELIRNFFENTMKFPLHMQGNIEGLKSVGISSLV